MVTMVSPAMKQVHERAGEQQEVGKNAVQVSLVFCQQKEKSDCQEAGQYPPAAVGRVLPMCRLFRLMHDISLPLRTIPHGWAGRCR